MNLTRHLRQTVTVRRKTGENNAGEFTYGGPEDIKGLFQPDEGLVRSATGQLIEAESQLLTVERVGLGDLVSGTLKLPDGSDMAVAEAEVRSVTPIIWRGRVSGFQLRL